MRKQKRRSTGFLTSRSNFVASTMTQPVINDVTSVIPDNLERSVYFSGCGELISMLGVCDGAPDCSTGEDELNCTQPGGLKYAFA